MVIPMNNFPQKYNLECSLLITLYCSLTYNLCLSFSEGVVLLDPDYVKDRKVFIHLLGAFWYGRDDVDLLGLNYHKDLYLMTKQIYPPINFRSKSINLPHLPLTNGDLVGVTSEKNLDPEPPGLTKLQERLMRKLGSNAYPFYFQVSFSCFYFHAFVDDEACVYLVLYSSVHINPAYNRFSEDLYSLKTTVK